MEVIQQQQQEEYPMEGKLKLQYCHFLQLHHANWDLSSSTTVTSQDFAEGFEPIVHDMDQIRTGSVESIFQLTAGMQRKNGGRM